jgi:hypothetical protein
MSGPNDRSSIQRAVEEVAEQDQPDPNTRNTT